MQITRIRFRRLQSHNVGFGHDAVEAEAIVGDGETAEQALGELQHWVEAQLAEGERIDELRATRRQVELDVEELTRDRDRLRREADEIRKIVSANTDLLDLAVKAGRDDLVSLFEMEVPF